MAAIAFAAGWTGVPDGENTSGLGETGLLLDTADPLLEDGGNLGRGGLCVGGIGADGAVVEGSGCAGLKIRQHSAQRESSSGSSAATPTHQPSFNAAPMASRIGSGSFGRWRDGLRAQLRRAAMDLQMRSVPWQQRPPRGGSTGG